MFLAGLGAEPGVEGYADEADGGHQITVVDAEQVADFSHDWRDGRAADDGHDDACAAGLGAGTQAFYSKGKDGGIHHGHEEAVDDQTPNAQPAGMEEGYGADRGIDDSKDAEKL